MAQATRLASRQENTLTGVQCSSAGKGTEPGADSLGTNPDSSMCCVILGEVSKTLDRGLLGIMRSIQQCSVSAGIRLLLFDWARQGLAGIAACPGR